MRSAPEASKTRARVIRGYTCQYLDPIQLQAGDVVSVGREDEEYPGWLWCTGPDGRCGWVPADLLIRRATVAEAREDYDATELSVHAGEEVDVESTSRGWVRVRNAAGQRGWIPDDCLAPAPGRDAESHQPAG